MIKFFLTIIFLLILTLILKNRFEGFNISEYQNYKKGLIKYPIDIIDRTNNDEIFQLKKLSNYLLSIPKFNKETIINLLTPYKEVSMHNKRWGIFSNLDIEFALNQLNFKKNMSKTEAYNDDIFPYRKINNQDPLLNENQIKNLEIFIKKKNLIFKILKKLDRTNSETQYCSDSINIFFKSTLLKLGVKLNDLNSWDKDYLNSISYNNLLEINNLLEKIPINICVIINLITEIENLKILNKYKFKKCFKLYNNFIKKQLNLLNIDSKHLLSHSLNDLKYIKQIYKYLNKVNIDCLDLEKNINNLDFIKDLQKIYKVNLIKKIKLEKEKIQKLDCKDGIMDHIYKESQKYSIPYYLGSKIEKYTESNLESFLEIFGNLPKCKDMFRDELIDKILALNDYFIVQGGHAFGCHEDLNKFREKKFKENKLKLPIPKVKEDFYKYSIIELNTIIMIYEITPSCYQIYKDNINFFDKKITNYLNEIYSKKSNIPDNLNNFYNQSDFTELNLHPYYNSKNKIKILDKSLQNNLRNDVKKSKTQFQKNNQELNFDNILDNAELNNQYKDNLFKDVDNKIINKEQLELKFKKIENKINKCCKRNSNSDIISQLKNKGYSSAFVPEIIIDK